MPEADGDTLQAATVTIATCDHGTLFLQLRGPDKRVIAEAQFARGDAPALAEMILTAAGPTH